TAFTLSCDSPAPTHTYTLSLHDALPISARRGTNAHDWEGLIYGRSVVNSLRPPSRCRLYWPEPGFPRTGSTLRLAHWSFTVDELDRKSTRLNSSHQIISYAVFCLKKKKK